MRGLVIVPMIAPIRKALTFRASSIGDCLMGKYLLENIHVQFPQARCGIVVASRAAMVRDLCAAYPWIEVIEANRRDIRGLIHLWNRFHGSDLVVTQYTGKVGTKFALGSKLAARVLARRGGLIGFHDASSLNGILYDQVLPLLNTHSVAGYERDALLAVGLTIAIPYPRLLPVQNEETLSKFSLTEGKFIIVHFFAGNKGRSISPKKARILLNKLRERFPDSTLVISGAKDDRDVAEVIGVDIANVKILAGGATLQEMMVLVAASQGTVSVDTGIAHITAHLGKPLVVLRTCLWPNWWFPEAYGPTAPIRQFSQEELCTPHIAQDYPTCLDEIGCGTVADAAREIFLRP